MCGLLLFCVSSLFPRRREAAVSFLSCLPSNACCPRSSRTHNAPAAVVCLQSYDLVSIKKGHLHRRRPFCTVYMELIVSEFAEALHKRPAILGIQDHHVYAGRQLAQVDGAALSAIQLNAHMAATAQVNHIQ